MSRLSKQQIARHEEACALLEKPELSLDEREFIINHWQESANHVNSAAGAFFTPLELAFQLALETKGCRTFIDLCAGIGALSYATWQYNIREGVDRIVCVEINPDYVAVGRKVLPEAEWICASVVRIPASGRFDMAIGNPPFGKAAKITSPRYSGEDDLAVIDMASDIADFGTFIIPQMSAPFVFSGSECYQQRTSAKYDRFHEATGIELHAGCGVDCDYFRDQWRGVAPRVEIVTADFTELHRRRENVQPDLFGEAA